MSKKELTEVEKAEIKAEKLKEYNHKYYLEKTIAKRAKKKAETKAKGYKKVCPICNKEFKATNKRTKYCSNECKRKAISNAEKLRKQDPSYLKKWKEWRKEYYKSDKYKAVRQKYANSEKGKARQKAYLQTEKGKAKAKEISRKAYAKYYAKKRELEGKAICPICKKEFIKDIDHRLYCSAECRQIAKDKLLEAKKEARIVENTVVKTCPICNTKFKSSNKNEKYCSKACKELALKLKARIRMAKRRKNK